MYGQFIEILNEHKDAKYWVYNDIQQGVQSPSDTHEARFVTCVKPTIQLKAAVATADHRKAAELQRLHVRKADVFNTRIAEDTEAATLSGDTYVIAMNYKKNLPLPLTRVDQEANCGSTTFVYTGQ